MTELPPALSTHQDVQTFEFDRYKAHDRSRPYLGPHHSDSLQVLKIRIREYYALDELVEVLKSEIVVDGKSIRRYRKITLQFPDVLVSDSAMIVQELQEQLNVNKDKKPHKYTSPAGEVPAASEKDKCVNCKCDKQIEDFVGLCDVEENQKVWILADTSYSPCCIDEVAAEHVSSDLVVHFGDACLNPIEKLPAVYVFGKPYLDFNKIIERFKETYTDSEEKILLMADAPYTYHLDELYIKLKPSYPNTCYADLLIESKTNIIGYQPKSDSLFKVASRRIIGSSETYTDEEETNSIFSEYSLFHINTPEPPRLLQLSTNFSSVSILDPKSETVSQGPFPNLMRRYRYMHVARTAGTVGILVNTLSLKNTKTLLNTVASAIRDAGKKHYMFVVGKPNVAKLANFESIDIWCVLGCGQSGIIVDSIGEYFKPIITPYELQLALSPEISWTGKWVTDFKDVLNVLDEEEEETKEDDESKKDDSEDEAPEFNMVTGKYVSTSRPLRRLQHLSIENNDTDSEETSLVKKFSSAVAMKGTVSTSAMHLQTREWSGLGSDFKGEDIDLEGAVVEEGTGGVARGYDFDVKTFK